MIIIQFEILIALVFLFVIVLGLFFLRPGKEVMAYIFISFHRTFLCVSVQKCACRFDAPTNGIITRVKVAIKIVRKTPPLVHRFRTLVDSDNPSLVQGIRVKITATTEHRFCNKAKGHFNFLIFCWEPRILMRMKRKVI
jgi:hypothetical protein